METKQVSIEVGRVIYSGGYMGKGRGVIYQVLGDPAPASVKSLGGVVMMGGRCEINIAFLDDSRVMRLPECIAMNLPWRLVDEVLPDDEIAAILASSLAYEAAEKAKKDEAAAAFKAAADKARAEGKAKGLLPEGEFRAANKRGSAAAFNLRLELKLAGIKARVKQDSYSAIDVTVADSDREAAKAIALKYKAGNFDGMTDCYDYDPCPWGSVFGDVQYVFVKGGL